jgi:hypothetical protein
MGDESTRVPDSIHAYMHTYIHIYIHAYIHTYIHTRMHKSTNAQMHKYINPHKTTHTSCRLTSVPPATLLMAVLRRSMSTFLAARTSFFDLRPFAFGLLLVSEPLALLALRPAVAVPAVPAAAPATASIVSSSSSVSSERSAFDEL